MSRLPNIHPGEILREEFMKPLGISQNALARALDIPVPRINAIVNESRAITADSAQRLGRFFGVPAQFWLNLQSAYDIEEADNHYDYSRITRWKDIQPNA